MPYTGEHAARLNSPEKYEKFRRQNDKFGSGIDVIFGVTKEGTSEIQAIRFDSKKFTPDEARKWLKSHDYKPILFEEALSEKKTQKCCIHGDCAKKIQKAESSTHDAILQVLNRTVGKYYFPVEPFEATVDAWTGIPILFSERPEVSNWPTGLNSMHPGFKAYSSEITDEEIRAINGAVVGEIREPLINYDGRPKLLSKLVFTPEKARAMYTAGKISEETLNRTEEALKKVHKLIGEGNLSHSTGFTAPHNEDGHLNKAVIPNHLLVFEEDKANFPIDKGAIILNKETDMSDPTEKNQPDVIKSAFNTLASFFNGSTITNSMTGAGTGSTTDTVTVTGGYPYDNGVWKSTPVEKDMTDEAKKQLDEATALISAKDAEIKDFKEKLAAAQTDLDAFKKAQRDAEWENIKSKLPKGLVHKPEDEVAVRKMFEETPGLFANKILDLKKAVPTKESGETHSNKGEETDDPVETANELRMITGRLPRRA